MIRQTQLPVAASAQETNVSAKCGSRFLSEQTQLTVPAAKL
jgi:hypothetical protein